MFAKHTKATFALLCLLICSFVIVYNISTYEQALIDMFPSVDCDFISSMYGKKLQSAAVTDYRNIDERSAKQSDGPYQCFCEKELSNNYEKAISDNYGHPDDTAICGIYRNLKSR